jgi:hypothetical protein
MTTRIRELNQGIGVAVAATFLCGASLQTCRCQTQESVTPLSHTASSQTGHSAGSSARTVYPGRTSFYSVALACPAAPAIGCGSAAKPVLLELESSNIVSEAWLNRAGTLLAIVWSESSTSKQRSQIIQTCLKEKDVQARSLSGAAKRRALKDFESGNAWYRGAAVDQLSEEEAGIVARRWVTRIRERVVMPDPKAEVLEKGFTGVVRQKLLGQITRGQAKEEMANICREHLDEKDVAVLMEAFAQDPPGLTSPR